MKYLIAIFAVLAMWATGPALAGHLEAGQKGDTQFYCENLADALKAFSVENEVEALKQAPSLACWKVDGSLPVMVLKLAGIIYDPMRKKNVEIYECISPEGIIYAGVFESEGDPA